MESSEHVTVQAMVVRREEHEMKFSIALFDDEAIASAFGENLRVDRSTIEKFLTELQRPKLPHCAPVLQRRERPLLLGVRTKLLLEVASSYRLSAASELWNSDRDDRSVS